MRIAVVPTARRALVCAVCKAPLEDTRWRCDGCSTFLHLDCRAGLGRCPSLGCGLPLARGPARVALVAQPRRERRILWLTGVLAAAVLVLVGGALASRASRLERASRPVQSEVTRPIAPSPPPAVDLSHVRLGQEWVYTIVSGLAEIEQVYRIEAIESNRVRASLRTRVRLPGASQLTDAGEPVPFVWELPSDPQVSTRQVRITQGGRDWECMVTEVDGTTSWCPVIGQRPTFPPYVRIESDHMRSELREIREPR